MAKICMLLLAALLILCGGCAPTTVARQYTSLPQKKDLPPPPGLARTYMIRGHIVWVGSEGEDHVVDEGRMVGVLANGSYICWERPAGNPVISIYGCGFKCGKQLGSLLARVTFPVKAGMTYYLYFDALNYEPKSIPYAEAQKYLAQYPEPQIIRAPGQPAAGAAASGSSGARPAGLTDTLPKPSGSVTY